MTDPANVPEVIKAARIARRLSMRQVGDALGVSSVAVCHWEEGRYHPKGHRRVLLAALLHLKDDLSGPLAPEAPPASPHGPGAHEFTERQMVAASLGWLAARMESRVQAMIERDGSIEAAVTGPGIGISFSLCRDIARRAAQASELLDPDPTAIPEGSP